MAKRRAHGSVLAPLKEAERRIKNARRSPSTGLNLRGLRLATLPDSIVDLSGISALDLHDNRLTTLPDTLRGFHKLELLQIGRNNLEELPEWIGSLQLLVIMEAKDNHLSALPASLANLAQLNDLDVSGNRLTQLPPAVAKLRSLKFLDVSANSIASLPDWIGDLENLTALFLSGNEIAALPKSLAQLKHLQGLFVSRNKLASLPDSMRWWRPLRRLDVSANAALGIPPELAVTADAVKVLEYYFSKHESRPLNEAKLILVGRGGVGKTSLVKRLTERAFDPQEYKTDGIAITQWRVQSGADSVTLNVWDFGGQEIMHATHQFFLTKRSLYVLVLNAREGEQDGNIDYWLQLIESFGGDSPVFVVVNKIKDHPFDLNRRGLRAKFPAIRGFFTTDCEADAGIDELRDAIRVETDRLEHVRDPFPTSWFAIKERLANLPRAERQNFISFGRYQEICADNNVTEVTSQETLVGFLHDLGIVINFRDDPRLAETHVLNPEWVTNGIYKILNADSLARAQGELRRTDLLNVLDAKEYPRAMHLYLLDLMRKFELCYEIYESDGHYLVPELLGKEEPDLAEFKSPDALRFEYTYNILPEGLLPRFIVRSRALNKDLPRWRSGVVLSWDGNKAVVDADVQDKRVSIAVVGPLGGRRRLLSVIRADMEHLHRSIAKLQTQEMVPVPGHQGLAVEYETLRVLEEAGERECKLVHKGKIVVVQIAELLDGIDEPVTPRDEARRPDRLPARVVFSYAHEDSELRDQLETHLKLLQRQGAISTWSDRKIVAGETWAEAIDENFVRADIILLLVSADFLASDYSYKTEMQAALERHAEGKTRVVPVIVRACEWSDAPFSALQALPPDGKPVTSWANRDEAWSAVAKGIKAVATEVRVPL